MIGHRDASSALTLLVLLTGASSVLYLAAAGPVDHLNTGPVDHLNTGPVDRLPAPGEEDWRDEERRLVQEQKLPEKDEDEEELFKDVDPKMLAAVLLEALNHSQVERRREERMKLNEEEQQEEEGRTMERADRDRDGRQELEMLMAAQGKERERQEEEERRRAEEAEEKMTERVTSRTTSQKVPVQPQPEEKEQEEKKEEAATATATAPEEEEQLSPEELKSLETMMKEFPRLNTAAKRNERPSRGDNDVLPIYKGGGGSLAMSKKKLKWQEETQKALNFPTFRGGNFMDDFEDGNYGNAVEPLQSQKEAMEDDQPEEEQEEEVLSPEEEEARAKAEQEELRRQAAEAQRAKLEEEKLADIASDMLLRYMVKQNPGNRKYGSAPSNAAEDKRSDEERQAAAEEDDDIDPQTIDKLIEISSKLHLPADDVVDIISDVEKKKKKDLPPEASVSRFRQRPTSALSPPNSLLVPQPPANQNGFPVSRQPPPILKTWFQEKPSMKPLDPWKQPNPNLWPKPQKVVSVKHDPWFKPAKSAWTGYPPSPYRYPPYYQRKPDYYPVYVPPPPRPKLRYYVPKPIYTLEGYLGNSVDDAYAFPLKRRYHGWVQPRLRKPPAGLRRTPFYGGYAGPLYPPLPVSRPRIPAAIPVHQKAFYHPGSRDYYGKPPDDLEKFIQQILMKRPPTKD